MPQPDFQPTLIGPTVIVRPVAAADWPELFAAGSDPEIWKVHPTPDRYTEPAFRQYFDGALASNMAFVFVDRATNREVKRLMLDHAFTFVDTVIFWVGEKNWRSQGAMTKIGGIRRDGLFTREASGAIPYSVFEITKDRYQNGGRELVMTTL